MGQKTQESIAEPELTTLKKVDLSTVNETEDPHDQSNGRQINNSEEQGDEADLTKEVIPTKSHQDSPQPSLPTEQSLLSGNEQALSKQNSGKEPQASVINDPPMPIYHPPSTDEKVSTVCVNEEEAVLPNETSVGVEKVPEQSIQIHDTSSPKTPTTRPEHLKHRSLWELLLYLWKVSTPMKCPFHQLMKMKSSVLAHIKPLSKHHPIQSHLSSPRLSHWWQPQWTTTNLKIAI